MADSYVCSGAIMRCTMGDKTAKLTVLPGRTVYLCGQPMANISDHKSMVNLAPFGRCRSLGYPATASATAAHHGVLTPMPCVHNTPMPWMPGKTDYFDKSQPSLLKSCKLQCMWGGMISIVDDGQKGEGTQYVNKSGKNSAEEIQLESNEKNGLTPETVLDGIQLALDVAGFAPGVGAFADLTNAAIYAIRGDMVNAGLSLAAAVPGIGDAAAATKLVGKGMKAAKTAGKTAKVAEATKAVKTNEKAASIVSNTGKTSSSVGQKSLGDYSQHSTASKTNMAPSQQKPFGEVTRKQVAAKTDMAPGQQKAFGELTQRPIKTKSDMVSGQQKPFGELTKRSTESKSDLFPGQQKPFGELTKEAHQSPVKPNMELEEFSGHTGFIADAKPINANTVEELQHTKDVLESDEMSRKLNKVLDYNA